MSVNVGLLRRRKTTVLNGMNNARTQISTYSDKVSRLRTASSNLQSSLSDLEINKSNIDSLSIDNSIWKGTNENRFNGHYSTYKGVVRNFVQQTNNVKDTIDEELRQAEQSLEAHNNSLNSLQSTLDSLNTQISNAERG